MYSVETDDKQLLDYHILVCYTAVFSVVTHRSFPHGGEERCVTILKTAV